MINALGLLEVSGLVAGIDAVDAMLKSASVRLLDHKVLDPGQVTLVIEGDLAACRAALDAGVAAANRTGEVINCQTIGRPDKDTEWLVMHLQGVVRSRPLPPEPSPPLPTELLRKRGSRNRRKKPTSGPSATQ